MRRYVRPRCTVPIQRPLHVLPRLARLLPLPSLPQHVTHLPLVQVSQKVTLLSMVPDRPGRRHGQGCSHQVCHCQRRVRQSPCPCRRGVVCWCCLFVLSVAVVFGFDVDDDY